MKKFQYVTSLLATLGMCGVMGYAPEAWGQEANESEDALPPLVMVVVDTSTSMHGGFGTGYNRLTKAIAEIAGAPKVTSPGTISGSGKYLPRAYRDCSGEKCEFKYECISLGGTIAKLPYLPTSKANCNSYIDKFYDDYYENGVIHSYMRTVKFGFAGLADSGNYIYGYNGNSSYPAVKSDASGWKYGVVITDNYKKSSSGCGSRCGIYTADRSAPAPTIYPTVSDDVDDIYENNKAVLTSIRSYYAVSCTPLGPALADLYYMFTKPDPGIVAQPLGQFKNDNKQQGGTYGSLSGLVGTIDEKYGCRKKAVIMISDGEPQTGYKTSDSSQKGQYSNIWYDAERLSNAGIRVYTVLYAQASGSVNLKSGIGKTMNMTAWKGGTCRDEHGNTIGPDDQTGYDALVNSGRSCMFNASDSNALRSALVTVLSDMLEGTKSKTAVATTTAISQKDNFDDATGKWSNGYYNIYSGYNVTMGPVRNTVLQRTAIICDHDGKLSGDAGQFVVNDEQYLDMTKRLICRLRGSLGCNDVENTRYENMPKGCITKNVTYATSNSPESVKETTNTCLNERYIFTGNYASVSTIDVPRYAISTFGTTPKILKNTDIKNDNRLIAGKIPKAINYNGSTNESTAADANFLLENNTASTATACSVQMAKSIDDQVGEPNYILSPYECVEDFDCGTYGEENIPRHCDLGRCINPGLFATNQGCTSNNSAGTTKVCIGGYWRSKGSECTSHNKCEIGEVCHAGTCVPGTVKGCDVRQFMASVPLGTIEYATPVPVAPPTKAYKSMTYNKFSTRYWKRDSMLMVAANDGMLHAFILGDNEDGGDYKSGLYNVDAGLDIDSSVKLTGHPGVNKDNHEGDELWAFIPKNSYKNLYNLLDFGDQEFINSKPVVADVQLPGFKIDGDSWRTVIVGGFRGGGRGYYALDITNPAKPYILWEIDHQWQPWDSASVKYPSIYDNSVVSISKAIQNRKDLKAGTGYPFQLMGYSHSEPVITNMMIDNTLQPVAILAGGHSPSGDTSIDMVGKALYIVKLFPKSKEDLLVKTFYFDEIITGTPEVYPNNFNSVAQHIYVGDAKGALYRLTVADKFNSANKYEDDTSWATYNVNKVIEQEEYISMKETSDSEFTSVEYKHEKPIFNPGQMAGFESGSYNAVTFKPAVSLLGYLDKVEHPAIQITYGTGNNDNFNIASDEKHFVAMFADVPTAEGGYQLNAKDMPCFEPKVLVFNAGQSVNAGTFEDFEFGEQKYTIYKTDPVSNAPITNHQKMTGAPVTHNYISYFPTFVSDAQSDNKCASGYANIWKLSGRKTCPFIKDFIKPLEDVQNAQNDTIFKNKSFEELDSGTRVYGLELTNQMYCIADTSDGKNHVLAPQLLAQTGGETASFATDKGSTKLTSGKVGIESLAINLEAFKPEVSRVTWAGVYE